MPKKRMVYKKSMGYMEAFIKKANKTIGVSKKVMRIGKGNGRGR